jgi:hypothetical protein
MHLCRPLPVSQGRPGGRGGVLVEAMGMLIVGLGSSTSAASMSSSLAESGAGVGGLKKTWRALEGPALGCRLDASLEVGAGDMDPLSMSRRSSGLAICNADRSDWAFCLFLAMGGWTTPADGRSRDQGGFEAVGCARWW